MALHNVVMSSLFFAVSMASSYMIRKLNNYSRKIYSDSKKSSSIVSETAHFVEQSSKFTYNYSGVVINKPISSSDVIRLLINDDIIGHVVRTTKIAVHVYILSTVEDSSKSSKLENTSSLSPVIGSGKLSSLHYMSAIYSKLWDDIVHSSHLNLQCYVHTVDAPLLTRSDNESLFNKNIEAIYHDASDPLHRQLTTLLQNNGTSIEPKSRQLIIEDTNSYSLNYLSHRSNQAYQVYLFDADVPIPIYPKVNDSLSFIYLFYLLSNLLFALLRWHWEAVSTSCTTGIASC